MAFFTRVNMRVPILPIDENNSEQLTCHHRRHSSEPSTSGHNYHRQHTVKDNSNNTELINSRNENSIIHKLNRTNTSGITTTTINSTTSNTDVSKTIREVEENIDDDTNSGEPKRYEYVVDRVLGVEV